MSVRTDVSFKGDDPEVSYGELVEAAWGGDIGQLKGILEANPEIVNVVKATDEDRLGFSLLMLAAVQDHKDCVEYLMEIGADVNYAAEDGTGMTKYFFFLISNFRKVYTCYTR